MKFKVGDKVISKINCDCGVQSHCIVGTISEICEDSSALIKYNIRGGSEHWYHNIRCLEIYSEWFNPKSIINKVFNTQEV